MDTETFMRKALIRLHEIIDGSNIPNNERIHLNLLTIQNVLAMQACFPELKEEYLEDLFGLWRYKDFIWQLEQKGMKYV